MIEGFFSKLKHFRRIATRYDKLAANFLVMVQLASMRLWLRAHESHGLAFLWALVICSVNGRPDVSVQRKIRWVPLDHEDHRHMVCRVNPE